MADNLVTDIAGAVMAASALGGLGVSICVLIQGRSTHKLVNGAHTIALQNNQDSARRLAQSDPTPENLERAERADAALALHEAQASNQKPRT